VWRVFVTQTGAELQRVQGHTKSIRDLKFDSSQQLYFMTASVDTTAKLWDTRSLTLLKTFDTGRSINCCSISPLVDHVLVAGGQEAVDVALTRVDPAQVRYLMLSAFDVHARARAVWQFHVRIWHRALAAELGQIGGHFGPVNTISYSPDGKSFASGGEDGYVRVHHLDESYWSLCSDDKIEELLA
jgi:translation initiation factor 3 subunit I